MKTISSSPSSPPSLTAVAEVLEPAVAPFDGGATSSTRSSSSASSSFTTTASPVALLGAMRFCAALLTALLGAALLIALLGAALLGSARGRFLAAAEDDAGVATDTPPSSSHSWRSSVRSCQAARSSSPSTVSYSMRHPRREVCETTRPLYHVVSRSQYTFTRRPMLRSGAAAAASLDDAGAISLLPPCARPLHACC